MAVHELVASSANPWQWLMNVLIGVATLLVAYVIKFYWNRRNYPPGPFPLPFIGNILLFRQKGHVHETILKLRETYGDIFTIFLGPKPTVVLTELELARQAFKDKKMDFNGRPNFPEFLLMMLGTEGQDVIFSDFNRTWEVLRRVAHAATRKYAVSESLNHLVANVVDETLETIKEREGDQPFDPIDYVYVMVYSIIARSAYGSKYSLEDPEFVKLMVNDKRAKELNMVILMVEIFPFWRYFRTSAIKEFTKIFDFTRGLLKSKYKEHFETYESGKIRDFCDALIAAKKESELEEKENAKHLVDANLVLTLFDLFAAGTDTTKNTTIWMILLMANFPDVQKKMRDEIEDVIGEEIPNIQHKARCDYVNSFITECMRFRGVVPTGVPHKAMLDSSIGDFKILKDTDVMLHQTGVMMDAKHWTEPEVFRPERFLDADGKHNARFPAFVPFGVGRRACLGEKLALADLFFIVTRLLQGTRGKEISLPGGPGSANILGNDANPSEFLPHKFQIVIRAPAR